MHVISCYAPTFAPSRVQKDKFFEDLQKVLDKIPSRDQYMVLGDFKAHVTCVGSRQDEEDQWEHVHGLHGVGAVNDVGKELLSFLAINEATVSGL